MPMRAQFEELHPLNLTPMIDVLLVLVMFLLCTANMARQSSLREKEFDVRLPSASNIKTLGRLPDPLVVDVNRDAVVLLQGKRMTMEQLERELVAAAVNYSDQTVLIRADGQGVYQSVIDVMDACSAAGLHQMALAFTPKSQRVLGTGE